MKLIFFLVRRVLSLRYRVKLNGVENLKHDGPILILPNHVALVDPRIMISYLGKYIIASPVASEKYYKLPVMKQVMQMIGTVPIGEMYAGASAEDVKKVFANIVEGLKAGKNILIYPSGQIYRQDFESIKGKQAAYYIANNMPENTKVIGIRQRGLWGSVWSKARDNGKTTFVKAYVKSLKMVFANLVFFVPKRDVNLEIVNLTKEINDNKKKSLNEFNKFLEDFYNKEPKEELRYLKHFFYYNDVKDRKEPEIIDGSIKELSQTNEYDLTQVPVNIKDQIKEKIALIKQINKSTINDDSKLVLDLFFDSLDLAEIKSYIQANITGASNPPITDLKTLGDLYMMAIGMSRSVEKLKDCEWISKSKSFRLGKAKINFKINNLIKTFPVKYTLINKILLIVYVILLLFIINGLKKSMFFYFNSGYGFFNSDFAKFNFYAFFICLLCILLILIFKIKDNLFKIYFGNNLNILDLWKKSFSKNGNENFLWDNILGMQSKKDFTIKAYLIADYIKKIKGDYVGIMIPAVGSASLLIIATYLAGKTPVMFNWTLGKESFKHCKDFSKVEFILTSSNFYDKVKNDFLEEYKTSNTFLFLEDLLRDISFGKKIKALVNSKLMLIPKLHENGVILFTSGSESLPKAVPLTHTNLIENIKGALNIFEIKTDDILLGFLPPFHSFGFTINTIMPLITGLRVVYTPDPNDAKTILEIIKHTSVTAITSTPTFLKMIMALAKGDDLKNIRYAVVGAEKCPTEVFEKFKQLSPNGVILEGYGITECSPVLSINPIVGSKPGTVGKIIPNLDCKILSLDNMKEVKAGEQGMIYVSGSSIFNGYLDSKIENPFEEIDGKMYYKTGDLGIIDTDGYLSITGRLKRFIKIAGEMISLPFVEGILLEKYGSEEELKVAIEALEKDGSAKIVLFSIEHIELDEVNEYLRKRGVSNLVKVTENIVIEKIPVLGTGKTDYKNLKGMISI